MKQVYTRNTGRNMCRMSFIDEQKIIDKLEKVSKRRKVMKWTPSQGQFFL